MQRDQARRVSTAGAPFSATFLWMLPALFVATEAAGSNGESPPARENWTAATEDATTAFLDAYLKGEAKAREWLRNEVLETETMAECLQEQKLAGAAKASGQGPAQPEAGAFPVSQRHFRSYRPQRLIQFGQQKHEINRGVPD